MQCSGFIPSTHSKKKKKEYLRAYRKPPMPKPRIYDSKAERDRKERRKEKQKRYDGDVYL